MVASVSSRVSIRVFACGHVLHIHIHICMGLDGIFEKCRDELCRCVLLNIESVVESMLCTKNAYMTVVPNGAQCKTTPATVQQNAGVLYTWGPFWIGSFFSQAPSVDISRPFRSHALQQPRASGFSLY